VNAKNNSVQTPLHLAAFRGHLPIVQCLLAASADINAIDSNGWTALHCAAQFGHLDVVERLLVAGAKVNAQDNDGATPLHDALCFGHLPVARYLLTLPKVDLTLTNSDGETAQDSARAERNDEIAAAIGAERAARTTRWSELRAGWCGAVVAGQLAAANAALDELLGESARGGSGAAADSNSKDGSACGGVEEHKDEEESH
jgi:hypothetical protein